MPRATRPGLKVLLIAGYVESAVPGNGDLATAMPVATEPFDLGLHSQPLRGLTERWDRMGSLFSAALNSPNRRSQRRRCKEIPTVRYQARLRRRNTPRPVRPTPKIASETGSGMGDSDTAAISLP